MRKVSIALSLLGILLATTAGAADSRSAGNIHFLDENGNIQRGQRCATLDPTPEEQAMVAATVDAFRQAYPDSAGARISIPVAFHVVYSSRRGTTEGNIPQSMIDDQIDVLNAAYAGTNFSFFLASVDRTNNRKWFTGCYGGQERRMKQSLSIDPAHNLNIYTCKPGSGILGYAYLPQSLPEDSYYQGVVALYSSLPGGGAVPYDEGDTITHEVGHYLGLYHTFENGCSSPGDEVADTPYEASPAFGCPVGRDTCPQAGLDPIFNFMDYTDDACMDEFTSDQSTRMDTLVAIYKPSL